MTFLQRYRGHLFYKYMVIFVTLGSGALLTSGLVEIYFSYQETRTALTRIQWEEAENAALKIRQFLKDIERQIAWTLAAPWGGTFRAAPRRLLQAAAPGVSHYRDQLP